MEFRGVMTAITTPFNDDLTVDHGFLAKHARWLVEHGCTGIVPLGSLGEGNTLQFDEKLAIVETFAGLDDMPYEAVWSGATGWIAGLVNALPEESVRVFDLAVAGRRQEAFELYAWFLPLLRMDTVPEFVQLIKLVQAEVGIGSETVRPPRQAQPEADRREALALIRERLATRPRPPA